MSLSLSLRPAERLALVCRGREGGIKHNNNTTNVNDQLIITNIILVVVIITVS